MYIFVFFLCDLRVRLSRLDMCRHNHFLKDTEHAMQVDSFLL